MDQLLGGSPDARRTKVLVVDDDEATRESLRDLLESADLDVDVCASAGEVLRRLPSLAKGCLLLDIGLPDYSGFAVFDTLNALGIGMPVIFMTGRPDLAERARTLPGAYAVFEKPLDDQSLLDAIGNALAAHSWAAKR